MIKQLIQDLAYDNIKLSQALTRAKIIAGIIKNEPLKVWIKKELDGYEYDDEMIPPYRKVWTSVYLYVKLPFGQTDKIIVNLPDEVDDKTRNFIEQHKINESIPIIEHNINSIEDSVWYLTFPPQMTAFIARIYKQSLNRNKAVVTSGQRVIGKSTYQNVLEQTKQKLLDTLIELNAEFPNLEEEKIMSKEDSQKAQNIITTHIYGNNNPLNLAAGLHVTQTITYNEITHEDEVKLQQLGVEQKDIDDLKLIISKNSADKPTLREKALKWLAGVSATVASKGLAENLPQIIDFIQNLVA